MSRGLASAITDELASGKFTMAHLVSIEPYEFDASNSGTFLYTDAPVDVTDQFTSTQEYGYKCAITFDSTTASLADAEGERRTTNHANLKVGMLVTSYGDKKYGGTYSVGLGNTIASIGTEPDFTLTNAALRTSSQTELLFSGGLGHTYKANGFLRGLGAIREQSSINIGSIKLGISGVNQTVISDILTNGHLNRKVTVKRVFLDSNYALITDAVFSVYSGRIESMNIRDSEEDSMMELSVANHWVDFERDSGRQTNNTSQQHYFPNDVSMEFAPQTGKKLRWGDVSSEDLSSMMQGKRSTRRSYNQ